MINYIYMCVFVLNFQGSSIPAQGSRFGRP